VNTPTSVPDTDPTVATTVLAVPLPNPENKHAIDESLLHEVVVHAVPPRASEFVTSTVPKLMPAMVKEKPPEPGALMVEIAVSSGLSNVKTAESVPTLFEMVTSPSKPTPCRISAGVTQERDVELVHPAVRHAVAPI
jgi:hypothetical protein